MAMIQFRECAVLDHQKTAELGKQVYEDGIEATITIDRRSTLIYQFAKQHEGESEADYLKHIPEEVANHWKDNLLSYMQGVSFCDGTPLSAMTWISSGAIETLRSAGVGSVEMLANVTEGVLEPFGLDGASLRKQAQAWLQDKSGRAVATMKRQEEKIEELNQENAEMKNIINSMRTELEALKADKKKK